MRLSLCIMLIRFFILYSMNNLSFEFFPPKTALSEQHLQTTWKALKVFQPEYCSVTHGAGGATLHDKTAQTIFRLQQDGLEATPHLTCIGACKAEITAIILKYQTSGIRHVVALRGDYPPNAQDTGGDFNYASELVQFIRELTGEHFCIKVAAYPEFHPQALNAFSDLENLKRKMDLGATSAITQYFYNSDSYFEFLEGCQKLAIHMPIKPGIMPIDSYERITRISRMCGAELPLWLNKRLHSLQHDPVGFKEYCTEMVARLCERLIQGGIPGLHFYTLNQAEPTVGILQHLNR